jgi:hypothetical protein
MPDLATPETALSRTPDVLAQAALPQAALPARGTSAAPGRPGYDRAAALAYARANWNTVCTDGFIALSGKAADMPDNAAYQFVRDAAGGRFEHLPDPDRERAVVPGTAEFVDPTAQGKAKPVAGGVVALRPIDDCTHFISCCIGQVPKGRGGGIPIRGDYLYPNGPYGIVGVGRLKRFLLDQGFAKVVGTERTTEEKAIHGLSGGDLVVYHDANGNDQHFAMLLGDGSGDSAERRVPIACHTISRSDDPSCTWSTDGWKLGFASSFTFLHMV